MKNYFIFPSDGSAIRVEKLGENYKLNIEDRSSPEYSFKEDTIVIKYNYFHPSFTKETLINELEKFLEYIKKYG